LPVRIGTRCRSVGRVSSRRLSASPAPAPLVARALSGIVRSCDMRRTRILATIGPASESPDVISAMLAVGVDAFRLNFSHGTRADHEALCRRIREVAEAEGRDVTILQDLSGPKIRTGKVAEPVTLENGDALVI